MFHDIKHEILAVCTLLRTTASTSVVHLPYAFAMLLPFHDARVHLSLNTMPSRAGNFISTKRQAYNAQMRQFANFGIHDLVAYQD